MLYTLVNVHFLNVHTFSWSLGVEINQIPLYYILWQRILLIWALVSIDFQLTYQFYVEVQLWKRTALTKSFLSFLSWVSHFSSFDVVLAVNLSPSTVLQEESSDLLFLCPRLFHVRAISRSCSPPLNLLNYDIVNGSVG